MEKAKKNIIISAALIILAIVYTICVQVIDVMPVGPVNPENGMITQVGFASINKSFANGVGTNMFLYDLTKYLGYLSLLLVAVYGLIGVMQLVKRKSLAKVDKEIIMLGIFYAVVLAVYVLFELYVVNYRPIVMDGELEASYPSSHTMLAICVCGSAIIVNKKLFKDFKGIEKINLGLLILLVVTLIGRLLSGVHWLSDIVGGVIISLALLETFKTAIELKK